MLTLDPICVCYTHLNHFEPKVEGAFSQIDDESVVSQLNSILAFFHHLQMMKVDDESNIVFLSQLKTFIITLLTTLKHEHPST